MLKNQAKSLLPRLLLKPRNDGEVGHFIETLCPNTYILVLASPAGRR